MKGLFQSKELHDPALWSDGIWVLPRLCCQTRSQDLETSREQRDYYFEPIFSARSTPSGGERHRSSRSEPRSCSKPLFSPQLWEQPERHPQAGRTHGKSHPTLCLALPREAPFRFTPPPSGPGGLSPLPQQLPAPLLYFPGAPALPLPLNLNRKARQSTGWAGQAGVTASRALLLWKLLSKDQEPASSPEREQERCTKASQGRPGTELRASEPMSFILLR